MHPFLFMRVARLVFLERGWFREGMGIEAYHLALFLPRMPF